MNNLQRNNYLTAMQIDTWLPRINLPYAAPSNITIDVIETEETNSLLVVETDIIEATEEVIVNKDFIINIDLPPLIETPNISEIEEVNNEPDRIASFSLQLMQAGSCLLLVELPTGEAFQIRDPVYQLLRNILRAAQLPDSPQWLGDIIHWPLFKQAAIPQGRKEAQQFLQSFISTYQEQVPNSQCLWLIGLSAIRYTTGFDEQHYYQTPIIEPLGQTLLSPSLDLLVDSPQQKAALWQSIRQLIPLWQD